MKRTVIDDGAEFSIALEVSHQVLHPVNTVDEIDDPVLIRLLVEGDVGVVDAFGENGWETLAHDLVRERVGVVSTEGGP